MSSPSLSGDDAEVEVVMPADADPHEFQPSARQAAEIREADLRGQTAPGSRPASRRPSHGAEEDGTPVFDAIDHVATIEAAEDARRRGGGRAGRRTSTTTRGSTPTSSPTPPGWPTAAEALAGVLADEVPALDTDAFRDRAAGYVAELRALDAEVDETLAAVPAERRKLVTNHDVFAYFADRYGFEVVGAVIPSTTTQAAASAAEIDDLAATVEAEGVLAVFADTSSPEDLADALAAEVGGDVAVVALYSESLGEAGSGADTYAGMMRTNASRIAEALAP